MIDQLLPKTNVPGHGKVTDLATARAHTRDLLLALRGLSAWFAAVATLAAPKCHAFVIKASYSSMIVEIS